jgi:hypothetical protein
VRRVLLDCKRDGDLLRESIGAWLFVLFSKFNDKEVCRDPLGDALE